MNKIAHLDPKTKEITEYQDEGTVPGERPSKHTVRMDEHGNLWMSGSPFSSFDVKTKKFTHYMEVPSSYGVIRDSQGNMWFAVYNSKDGAIGKVDAKTGKLSRWPTNSGAAQRLQVDSDGIVWFSGRTRNTIGRFDPKTETFKTFPLPGPSPSPYPLEYRQESLHLVRLNRSGHHRSPRPQQRASCRIPLPAFGRLDEGIFPRFPGTDVVRDTHK